MINKTNLNNLSLNSITNKNVLNNDSNNLNSVSLIKSSSKTSIKNDKLLTSPLTPYIVGPKLIAGLASITAFFNNQIKSKNALVQSYQDIKLEMNEKIINKN